MGVTVKCSACGKVVATFVNEASAKRVLESHKCDVRPIRSYPVKV